MSRKVRRVQYNLDSGDVKNLAPEEIVAILRAADELVGKGGRALLVKILKGSKDKKIRELELDQCPVYGYYHSLTMEEISHRVDWMIRQNYLEIQYDYRLPVIIFSKIGWEIEKRTYAQELYDEFCKACVEQDEEFIETLKEHTNREVVWIILDLITERGQPYMLPFLQKWKEVEVRKIREGISKAVQEINGRSDR